MEDYQYSARDRLLQRVIDMLVEGQDVDAMTTRAIGAEADVNAALISYYFGSKDGLLRTAVDSCLEQTLQMLLAEQEGTPVEERIRNIAKALSDILCANPCVARIALRKDVLGESTATLERLVPALVQVYGGTCSEYEVRLLAAQFVLPLEALLLNQESFNAYLGIDINDWDSRHALIDGLLDTILQTGAPPAHGWKTL